MKRVLLLLLALITALLPLSSCAESAQGEVFELHFSDALGITDLERRRITDVTVIGFMSTALPESGGHFYLMDQPRQSSPFNIPNTANIVNTVAVIPREGEVFRYTDRAVRVTGTLEFGEFKDELGYEYSYRIKDAVLDYPSAGELGEPLSVWQRLADADVISEIYRMYNYVSFLCFWPTYTAPFEGKIDYLYPGDAVYFYQTAGSDYNYGYSSNYFYDLTERIRAVDEDGLALLIENVAALQALASDAISELEAGNYTRVPEYTGTFNDGREQYKMNKADEYKTALEKAYRDFAEWLSDWQA